MFKFILSLACSYTVPMILVFRSVPLSFSHLPFLSSQSGLSCHHPKALLHKGMYHELLPHYWLTTDSRRHKHLPNFLEPKNFFSRWILFDAEMVLRNFLNFPKFLAIIRFYL